MVAERQADSEGEPPYRWPIPPEDGWTADDLDKIPDLPPHTELIDGSLVFVSPQKAFHTLVLDFLVQALRRIKPASLQVRREMTIALGKRDRPEPDLIVLKAYAVSADGDETSYRPEDVLLAVEVVSPDSEHRDREVKPRKYAAAGIPHFWRVEQGKGRRPLIYTYDLDTGSKLYAPTGKHEKVLMVERPFPVDLDLAEIDDL